MSAPQTDMDIDGNPLGAGHMADNDGQTVEQAIADATSGYQSQELADADAEVSDLQEVTPPGTVIMVIQVPGRRDKAIRKKKWPLGRRVKPTALPRFQELAIETKHLIWEYAERKRQIVKIKEVNKITILDRNSPSVAVPSYDIPPLLHVCGARRYFTQVTKQYVRAFAKQLGGGKYIWFDFKIDVLVVERDLDLLAAIGIPSNMHSIDVLSEWLQSYAPERPKVQELLEELEEEVPDVSDGSVSDGSDGSDDSDNEDVEDDPQDLDYNGDGGHVSSDSESEDDINPVEQLEPLEPEYSDDEDYIDDEDEDSRLDPGEVYSARYHREDKAIDAELMADETKDENGLTYSDIVYSDILTHLRHLVITGKISRGSITYPGGTYSRCQSTIPWFSKLNTLRLLTNRYGEIYAFWDFMEDWGRIAHGHKKNNWRLPPIEVGSKLTMSRWRNRREPKSSTRRKTYLPGYEDHYATYGEADPYEVDESNDLME